MNSRCNECQFDGRKLINEVIEKVSGELASKRDQFRISIGIPVENPETTIETFNKPFQLGKTEKVVNKWAWEGKT